MATEPAKESGAKCGDVLFNKEPRVSISRARCSGSLGTMGKP